MFRRDFLKLLAVAPIVGKLELGHLLVGEPIQKTDFSKLSIIQGSNYTGLSCVWADLKTGDHLVIGGRPSIGKTSVAMNMLNELSVNKKNTAAYFGLEESNTMLMNRLLSIRTGISLAKIKTGKLDDQEYEKIISESENISKAKFYIDDSAQSINEIVSRIRDLKDNNKDLKYVFTLLSGLISN